MFCPASGNKCGGSYCDWQRLYLGKRRAFNGDAGLLMKSADLNSAVIDPGSDLLRLTYPVGSTL
jgi:hypothetical protein